MKSSDCLLSAWNQCFLLSYSLQPRDIVESHRIYFQIYFHHTEFLERQIECVQILEPKETFKCFYVHIQPLFCKVKMAMSKYQLAGSLEKKTLTLPEKIKLLDYAEANEKLGCRNLADVFKIGKTAANNILKNKQMLREQYEHFHDKTKKGKRPRKYKVINDMLYEWYQKCLLLLKFLS